MIKLKTSNKMSSVFVVYKNQALCEDEDTFGVSHLLEHMICNSHEELNGEYTANGIDTNAFTSKNNVVFYLQGLEKVVDRYAPDFVERILNYKPTEKDFSKEKPIVFQEYLDSFAGPYGNAYSNLLSKKYGFVGPIGFRNSVENITLEKVDKFFNRAFSGPQEIVISNQSESDLGIKFIPTMLPEYKYEKLGFLEGCDGINPQSADMFFTSNELPINDKSFYVPFICKMLSRGLESPLYKEVREKLGLVYWIGAGNVILDDKQIFMISTSSKIGNKDQIKEAIDKVISNPKEYLTKERFDDIVNNTRIGLEKAEQYKHGYEYASLFIEDRRTKIMCNLDKLNYDEMIDVYNDYVLDNEFDFQTHYDINEVEE